MKTVWGDATQRKSVVAPVSLIISAFAPVGDVRKTWTPQLRTDLGATVLMLIDLGKGANRLGGSALAQVYGELGSDPADLAAPALLTQLAAALAELRALNVVLAYHDRSDGGVFATLVEMAFAVTAASTSNYLRSRVPPAPRARQALCSPKNSASYCR
jgi:phosphoribosylformylglycinamidine synthase